MNFTVLIYFYISLTTEVQKYIKRNHHEDDAVYITVSQLNTEQYKRNVTGCHGYHIFMQ